MSSPPPYVPLDIDVSGSLHETLHAIALKGYSTTLSLASFTMSGYIGGVSDDIILMRPHESRIYHHVRIKAINHLTISTQTVGNIGPLFPVFDLYPLLHNLRSYAVPLVFATSLGQNVQGHIEDVFHNTVILRGSQGEVHIIPLANVDFFFYIASSTMTARPTYHDVGLSIIPGGFQHQLFRL